MYLNIVFLPFIGFLLVAFFGSYFGKKGSVIITCTAMLFTLLFSCISFYEVNICNSVTLVPFFYWVDSSMFTIHWGFLFDSLTTTMLIVVTSVSFLVHMYSSEYMGQDPHLSRFMSYLSLFTFFMIILVTSDNFIQLFVGWEGVGLCSYLLISFWSSRIQANKSAMKAMIVNRIGDLGLCVGLFYIFSYTGTLEFGSLFNSALYWIEDTVSIFSIESNLYTVACLALFIGSVGKSAQIGLHTWLPDAMEGPTPVSALIHAATMVTAGVVLILRCSILFEMSSTALLVLTFIGASTAFFAATVGTFQNDLKKVIAYSTCSQLGYMVFACGLSNYTISLYHLANHAFFKALLFLSAGAVIHAVNDEQDMRKMGGLLQLLPFSYTMIVIGSFSLMGLPFLTGFYSKDMVLEASYATYFIHGHFSFWLGSISAALTSFYSIRLVYLTFITRTNSYRQIINNVHEAPFRMAFPLFVLSIASIFIGYLTRDMFLGGGTYFWGNTFFTLPQSFDLLDSEFIPTFYKLIPVIFSISGGLFSFVLYTFFMDNIFQFTSTKIGRRIYSFFNQKWYFDVVYQHLVALKLINFGGNTTFQLLDKGFIELFGPYGISKSVKNISKNMSNLQTGWIHHSVFILLLGIVVLISLFGISPSFLLSIDLNVWYYFILFFICSIFLV